MLFTGFPVRLIRDLWKIPLWSSRKLWLSFPHDCSRDTQDYGGSSSMGQKGKGVLSSLGNPLSCKCGTHTVHVTRYRSFSGGTFEDPWNSSMALGMLGRCRPRTAAHDPPPRAAFAWIWFDEFGISLSPVHAITAPIPSVFSCTIKNAHKT